MFVRSFFVLFVVMTFCDAGFISWIFGRSEKKKNNEDIKSTTKEMGSLHQSTNVKFEITIADEKFLSEASKFTSLQMSELDVCHHKVILALHSSCSEMTEEELAKVAVNLLNCQSQVEGRTVYTCSKDMSIAECTQSMDANTWNAYHIVSNRARAVCYATRQQQFQAKTQMTVNQLVFTADEQMKNMHILQVGQETLGKATSETLESLSDGHKNLISQQQKLSSAHHSIQGYVTSNIRQLTREKQLITSGHRELTHLTQELKLKIGEAQQQLSSQEMSQRSAHQNILDDLSKIQENAITVRHKLDESMHRMLQSQYDTLSQYSRVANDIEKMNETVHSLLGVLQATHRNVEERLSWISSLVGGTGETVQKVYTCVLHCGYFVVGMVAGVFLKMPYASRVLLVILVPLNAVAELEYNVSLTFLSLTFLLIFSCIATFCLRNYMAINGRNNFGMDTNIGIFRLFSDKKQSVETINTNILTEKVLNGSRGNTTTDDHMSTPASSIHSFVDDSSIFLQERNQQVSTDETFNDSFTSILNQDFVRHKLLDSCDDGNGFPKLTNRRSSNSSQCSTPMKQMCSAICRNGQRCRNYVYVGVYCHRHLNGSRECAPVMS